LLFVSKIQEIIETLHHQEEDDEEEVDDVVMLELLTALLTKAVKSVK
jgi:hypothetical protein